MKICIITMYNNVNSGAHWQARILGDYIRKMGHQVVYLETKIDDAAPLSINYRLKEIKKGLFDYNFSTAILRFCSFFYFYRIQKIFSTVPIDKDCLETIDCFILGSDTIWNLGGSYFGKHYDIYWGMKCLNKPVITYAASVANTPLKQVLQYPDIIKAVHQWKFISVRDYHTREVIEHITEKTIYNVLDPTLLLRKDDYKKYFIKGKVKERYIFLYLFERLSSKQIQELSVFAKQKKLKIISGCNSLPYADKAIINTPNNFLKYLFYADFVITDTFHGTVFSTNFEKQFVCINRNKIKVNEYLSQIELSYRMVKEKESFSSLLLTKIDYIESRKKLESFRKISKKFLIHALKSVFE